MGLLSRGTNASEGALPLCLEGIVEGCIMVFDRRKIRVSEFEGQRE